MDGVIVVDKPEGITSHKVVEGVREMVGKRVKVGHLGTLDPIATGVLPLCLGRATKLSGFLMGGIKEYVATVKLGEETDTLDREGAVVLKGEIDDEVEGRIEDVLKDLEGEIEQVPPAYSAIKKSGIPLYRLVRRGIAVEPEPRKVRIHKIELVDLSLPFMTIRVVTSPGTYIRSLCRDIGRALGCYGHMYALRRLRSGEFTLEGSITLESLKGMDLEGLERYLIPVERILPHFKRVDVDRMTEKRIRNGTPPRVSLEGLKRGEKVRFFSREEGRLLAIGEVVSIDNGGATFALLRVLS